MVTLILVAVTVITSVIAFSNRSLYRRFVFNAYDIKHFNNHYRFITYGFLHADWMHLLVNMMVLYMFGSRVEIYYTMLWPKQGWFFYLLLYLAGIVMSTIPSFGKHKDDYSYNAVGASGAVSSVLFASILFEPLGKVYFYFIPIGIPAVIFGVLYLAYSWYMSKKNLDNIGHDVHLWGAIFGLLFTLALKPAIATAFIRIISDAVSI